MRSARARRANRRRLASILASTAATLLVGGGQAVLADPVIVVAGDIACPKPPARVIEGPRG